MFLFFASSVLLAQTKGRQGQLIPLHPSAEPAPTKTSIDPSKEADIRQLLEATGAKAVMMQRMSAMESSIRPLLTSSLPPGEYRAKLADLFFEKFRTKADPDALIDLAVPIYDKYFSDDDIKSMLAFYATPVGKKMVQVLPQLTNESMEVGQKWGQETGRETMIEVLQEHPELKEAMDRAKDSPLPK